MGNIFHKLGKLSIGNLFGLTQKCTNKNLRKLVQILFNCQIIFF